MLGMQLAGRHRSALRDPGIREALKKATELGGRIALCAVRHTSHGRRAGTLKIRQVLRGGVRIVLYGKDILVEATVFGRAMEQP